MLRARWLIALALGIAGPAAAQDMPIGRPDPVQPAEQHATQPAAKHHPAHAAKPAAQHAASANPTVPLPQAAPKPAAPAIELVKTVTAPPLRLPPPRPAVAKPEQKTAAKPDDKQTFSTASLPKAETIKVEPGRALSSVFADVPFDERIKIQAALLWSGDYTGDSGGEDPMVTAVKNYQKRIKSKVTGALTPAERANLVAAARNHEQEFGWSVVTDPATGVRIGLPTKMVPNAREAARGTLWSSAHGEVQVETFRIKDPKLTLAALFEQEKKEPATRRVESSVLHDDNFFISGMQGLKMFAVRARLRDGEVRGFTIRYDQMMETIVSPVMVAMATAFSPFPERPAPFAALAKSVEYGNGLIVSARGHIVTDRRLTEGCQVIVAAGLGDAERIADDKDTDLALLRVYGQRKLAPVALAGTLTKVSDLTLIGIPHPKEQDGGKNGDKKLSEIKARLVEGSAIELKQPLPMAGFSGAAAVDAQGRLVGLTEMRNAVLASTEPSAPPVRLVGTEAIRAFLSAHNVDATGAAPAGDAKASLVRIICVRK